MKYTILTTLIFILLGCNNPNNQSKKHPNQEPKFSIVDTTTFPVTLKDSKVKSHKNYPPLYLGQKDTAIHIGYYHHIKSPPPPPLFLGDTSYLSSKQWKRHLYFKKFSLGFIDNTYLITTDHHINWLNGDSGTVNLFVDTNQIIKQVDFSHFQDSTFAFYAYPIFISNRTTKNNVVGFRGTFDLILQAQTSNGSWVNLQKHPSPLACGTGVKYFVIPPKGIGVSSIPFYKKGKPTKVRLKMGKNYSNTFILKIKNDTLTHR